jgi:hypothetical protein
MCGNDIRRQEIVIEWKTIEQSCVLQVFSKQNFSIYNERGSKTKDICIRERMAQ